MAVARQFVQVVEVAVPKVIRNNHITMNRDGWIIKVGIGPENGKIVEFLSKK
jgi:hypothetical protein